MLRIYLLIFVIGIVGTFGYGAYWYYNDTQQRIATLRENNAQLKVAVQTTTESLEVMQADVAKMANLNNRLQEDLQKAESYSDQLRGKLSRLDLVVEALKDAKLLEGKMNDATAELWRGFMEDTGNLNDIPLPDWLHSETSGTRDSGSDKDRKNSNSNSSKTKTTSTD